MNRFTQKWNKNAKQKKSWFCAGLDPASFEMGYGEKGLPENADLLSWSINYVETIAEFVCAIKYNTKYWNDEKILRKVIETAKEKGLAVIEDGKFADITDTNEAAIFFAEQRGADAVTIAPFAGNFLETVAIAKKLGLGSIGMCLMSNPEFAKEKNGLMQINSGQIPLKLEKYTIKVEEKVYLSRYQFLAVEIVKSGAEGAVIGSTDHISEEELKIVSKILIPETLILSPGFGAQGGQLKSLLKFFPANQIMVSTSRNLMFPKGSASTPEDRRSFCRKLLKNRQELLNFFSS